MSNQGFTPGPWSIGCANFKEEAEIGINGPGEYGYIICDMQEDGYDKETQEANARLIAAAPDLLEALEDLANDISERFDMDDPSTNPGMRRAVEAARAAIAKARSA